MSEPYIIKSRPRRRVAWLAILLKGEGEAGGVRGLSSDGSHAKPHLLPTPPQAKGPSNPSHPLHLPYTASLIRVLTFSLLAGFQSRSANLP